MSLFKMRIFKLIQHFNIYCFLLHLFFIYMLCEVVMAADLCHMSLCLRTVSKKRTSWFPVHGHPLSKRAERDAQDCHGARVQINTSLVIPSRSLITRRGLFNNFQGSKCKLGLLEKI